MLSLYMAAPRPFSDGKHSLMKNMVKMTYSSCNCLNIAAWRSFLIGKHSLMKNMVKEITFFL
jgi:hypothetical protein